MFLKVRKRCRIALESHSEAYSVFSAWHLYGHNVLRRNQKEVVVILRRLLHASCGVLNVDALQLVGYKACVAPRLGVAGAEGERYHIGVFLPCLYGEAVAVLLNAAAGYLEQFVDAEVGKLEAVGEARQQSGVSLEQFVHRLLVSAEHHGDVAPVLVGEQIHEQLHDDLSGVVLVLSVQKVCLVNHQDAALRHLHHLLHSPFLVAPKRADEGAAVAHHDVSFRERSRLV